MTKTTLNKIHKDKNFTSKEKGRGITQYTYTHEIKPNIKIDNIEYHLTSPVKHIIITNNYVLQKNEIELKDKKNNKLLDMLLDADLSEITMEYETTWKGKTPS